MHLRPVKFGLNLSLRQLLYNEYEMVDIYIQNVNSKAELNITVRSSKIQIIIKLTIRF